MHSRHILAMAWVGALFFCAFTILMPASATAALLTIQSIEIEELDEHYRVIVTTDGTTSYSAFTLPTPDRLVIDVNNTRWRVTDTEQAERSLLITRLRHGKRKNGATRVVLDLNAPVSVTQKQVLSASGDSTFRFAIDVLPDLKALEAQLPMSNEPLPDTVSAATGAGQEVSDSQPLTNNTSETGAAEMVSDKGLAPLRLAVPSPVFKPNQSSDVQSRSGGMNMKRIPVPVAPDERRASASKTPVPQMFRPGPTPVPAQKPERDTRKKIVVIDPGHGGIDPGAISKNGQEEKELTLKYALDLKRALEKTGRYNVVLTRMDDRFLRLRERIAIARRVHGDLFISLHADSNPEPSARGLSVYTLSENASDKEAAMLAQRENKAEILDGIDLSDQSDDVAGILIDLAQRESKNKSARMATYMVRELKPHISLVRNTHRFAGFAVLKLPDMPSVLVELGFMSNEEDERKLKDPEYGKQIIRSLIKAIDRYYGHQ